MKWLLKNANANQRVYIINDTCACEVTVGPSSLFVGRQIVPLELLATVRLVLGHRLIAIVHFVAAICVCCVGQLTWTFFCI
jgi:hypothetical protein